MMIFLAVCWIRSIGLESVQGWLFPNEFDRVLDVAFQPKSGVLASLAEDGWIVLWEAAVEAVQVLDGAEDGFCCFRWGVS
jgi:WD40 repeat protein